MLVWGVQLDSTHIWIAAAEMLDWCEATRFFRRGASSIVSLAHLTSLGIIFIKRVQNETDLPLLTYRLDLTTVYITSEIGRWRALTEVNWNDLISDALRSYSKKLMVEYNASIWLEFLPHNKVA